MSAIESCWSSCETMCAWTGVKRVSSRRSRILESQTWHDEFSHGNAWHLLKQGIVRWFCEEHSRRDAASTRGAHIITCIIMHSDSGSILSGSSSWSDFLAFRNSARVLCPQNLINIRVWTRVMCETEIFFCALALSAHTYTRDYFLGVMYSVTAVIRMPWTWWSASGKSPWTRYGIMCALLWMRQLIHTNTLQIENNLIDAPDAVDSVISCSSCRRWSFPSVSYASDSPSAPVSASDGRNGHHQQNLRFGSE